MTKQCLALTSEVEVPTKSKKKSVTSSEPKDSDPSPLTSCHVLGDQMAEMDALLGPVYHQQPKKIKSSDAKRHCRAAGLWHPVTPWNCHFFLKTSRGSLPLDPHLPKWRDKTHWTLITPAFLVIHSSPCRQTAPGWSRYHRSLTTRHPPAFKVWSKFLLFFGAVFLANHPWTPVKIERKADRDGPEMWAKLPTKIWIVGLWCFDLPWFSFFRVSQNDFPKEFVSGASTYLEWCDTPIETTSRATPSPASAQPRSPRGRRCRDVRPRGIPGTDLETVRCGVPFQDRHQPIQQKRKHTQTLSKVQGAEEWSEDMEMKRTWSCSLQKKEQNHPFQLTKSSFLIYQ